MARPLPGQKQEPAFDLRKQLEAADLLGAKALAWAGGIVTLLGVVFFFVLAANRGWVGPGIRITCGATVSVLVFGTGFWLRRRFGETFSSLAAVGAGIAGAFATLLAAASIYDMVSKPIALVLAASIAAVGLTTSLYWESQIVAALGLVGAIVVPGMLVFQGGLTVVGTGFAAIVFAAAAAVAVGRRWHALLAVAGGLSALEAMGLFADKDFGWSLVVLAAIFWALYLATGIAAQLENGGEQPTSATTGFVLGSAAFAAYLVAIVLGDRHAGRDQGIALLVAGTVYAATAVPLSHRAGGRTLSSLLYALGLTAGAVGFADILSGATLTYVWAGEAAVLAWLSVRVRDARFQIASAAYLLLAAVHALAFESRPDLLFVAYRHPGSGAPTMLAIAIAAVVFAVYARAETEEDAGLLAPLVAYWRGGGQASFVLSLGIAAVASAYAASLGILELAQTTWGGTERAFERGHVLVTAVWALAGCVGAVGFLRRRAWVGVAIAYGWLGLTLFKTLAFDGTQLAPDPRAAAFLAVGTALVLAGLAIHLYLPGRLDPVGAVAIVVSLGLALSAATTLLEGTWLGMDQDGVAVAAVALVYGGVGALVWPISGQRDLRSLLGALGLAVAAVAEGNGCGAGVAHRRAGRAAAPARSCRVRSRRRCRGPRSRGAADSPRRCERAPGPRRREHPPPDRSPGRVRVVVPARGRGRRPGAAPAHVGLDGRNPLRLRGLARDVGLVKRRRALRLGGFALFGISLGKLFVYDLAALSSITRALSFLAVGAFLLVGGFFYQRLSAQLEERDAS